MESEPPDTEPAPPAPPPRKSRMRWVYRIGIGLLVLLLAAVVVLRTWFNGEKLADFVEDQINGRIRGRVEIKSIDWNLRDLPVLVTGGWLPIEARGVKVFDDNGRKVLEAERVTAKVDAHSAMFGSHDLVFDELDIPDGGYVLIRQVAEPYPQYEYDYVTVSLLSAFYSKDYPSIYVGLGPRPGRIWEIRSFTAKGIQLEIEWEEAFKAVVDGVEARGSLLFDGKLPLAHKLFFTVRGDAASGAFCFGPGQIHPEVCPAKRKLELRDIAINRMDQLPWAWPDYTIANDFDWHITALTPEGARVTIDGAKIGYWTDYFGGDYLAQIVIDKAGPLASRFTDGLAGGPNLWMRAGVDGPALAPRVELSVRDLDLELPVQEGKPPLALQIPGASASFDLATYEGDLEQTVARGAGGEMSMSATFSLEPFQFDLHVGIGKPIHIGPYLPRDVRQLAGTTLEGGLHAFGDQSTQRIDIRNLRLGQARLNGTLYREGLIDTENPDKIDRVVHARDLVVALGRDTVSADGFVDFTKETFDFDLRYTALDAPRYLKHFGVPIVAQRVEGGAHVWGRFDDPRAQADLTAGGVPVVDRVDARLDYRRDLLTVEDASTTSLGGSINATAKVALGGRQPRIVDLRARAKDVQVSKLPGVGAVATGTLDGEITGSGTIDRFKAEGKADVADLDIAGDRYPRMHVEATTSPDGVQTIEIDVVREKGGELHATALHDRNHTLSGALSLRGLPVETFGFLAPAPEVSPVGGTVDAELALGGTWQAPLAEGTVSLARSWAGQAFLGTGDLRVEPTAGDRVRIRGALFQGKLVVDGTLGTVAPYKADLLLTVRRLEIDHFMPELARQYGTRGWVTGEVEVHTALAGPPEDKPSGRLRLSEVMLYLESEDPQGRPAHINLRNKTELAVSWDGVRAVLDKPALFEGPAGDIKVTGSGSEKALAFRIEGDVAVKLLAPYLREYFDEMSGNVGVAVDITGPMKKPVVQGTVEFEDVAVQLTGQDATVSVPKGKITVTNSQVAITDLTVRMVDEFSDERAELKIRGGVGMRDFKPNVWALQIEGQLGGKMLLAVAPRVFSSATGMAYVNVWFRGPGEVPEDIDGTLWFRCPQRRTTDDAEKEDYALVGKRCRIDRPLTLQMRGGGGHEVSINQGRVRFAPDEDRDDSHLLLLEKLAGWIDDEGRIQNLEGEASLHKWRPEDFDVTVTASGLPFRIPQTLDVTANVRRLRVVGNLPNEELDITGRVEIVDGRYIRNFNIWRETLLPERTTESSTPIWETNRMIGNAALSLDIDTRAFYVQNNLTPSPIEMSGSVQISGTPRRPRLDGVITVNHGSFKFPLSRATFTRTRGSVTFVPHQKFPSDTPSLSLDSEADYRESSGQEHVIHLSLTGTLDNLNWDLSTDRGLNKAQTTALLFAGRNADELIQQIPGGNVTQDPTKIDQGGGDGNVYDELVKDLAADFISLLLEDRITRVTKLDVARIEIGTSSVGVHAEKDLARNLKLLGDLEKSIRAWHAQGGVQLKFSDSWSGELEGKSDNFDSETEEDRAEVRVRAVWRRTYP